MPLLRGCVVEVGARCPSYGNMIGVEAGMPLLQGCVGGGWFFLRITPLRIILHYALFFIMIDTTRFQNTIHRFIELYGDRTEGIGDEIHGGFAWIDDAKFVLIGGGEAVIAEPPSWRRISRLFRLAEQLRKPILLWDLLFQADIVGPGATLLHRSAAQNSRLQLMKLPVPVIGVFDRLPLQSDFASVDAAILLQGEGAAPQPVPAAAQTDSMLVRVTADPSHLQSDILELLGRLTALPSEQLVDQRMDTIREVVGGT